MAWSDAARRAAAMVRKQRQSLSRSERMFSLASQNRVIKLVHPGTTAMRVGGKKISLSGAVLKRQSVVTKGGRTIKGTSITHMLRSGAWKRIGR